MFKIGDFSRLSNISVRMLRHYEKMGLISPKQVDEFTGYRYYSADQLELVGKIQKFKSLGFSLGVISKMLENPDNIQSYFEIRQKELQEELETITSQANMLDSVREILEKDENMMQYNVVLKDIPERYVMSFRQVLPKYEDEGLLWGELYKEYQKQNISFAPSGLGLAIYHDTEHKDTDVDVEAQSAITGKPGDHQDTDKIKFFTAPAVQTASVIFRGSFEQMPKVIQAIAQWIEDNGYRISGPMINSYHVSPSQDPNPENWVTEACIQVEKV